MIQSNFRGGVREEFFLDFIEDIEQFPMRFSPQQTDACGAEIGYTLEKRCCCQMSTYVQYTTVFVNAFYALAYLATEHGELLADGNRRHTAGVQQGVYLTEYPRSAYGTASYHHRIHSG